MMDFDSVSFLKFCILSFSIQIKQIQTELKQFSEVEYLLLIPDSSLWLVLSTLVLYYHYDAVYYCAGGYFFKSLVSFAKCHFHHTNQRTI